MERELDVEAGGALRAPGFDGVSAFGLQNARENKAQRSASKELRGCDIVCFSNDWNGDPLSKTHLMRILSRDNRILWVNSLGNRAPQASRSDAARIWRKVSDAREGVKEVEPNLFVTGPLALPFYGPVLGPVARRVNASLVRAQVVKAMRRLGFRRPISWSFLPSAAPIAGYLGEQTVIYHCVDEFSAFSDAGARIAEMEADLCSRADLVITSAERLQRAKEGFNPNTVLVKHGVDHTHFAKALDPATEVPADMAGLPRPIIGFYGLIADWVDLDLIRAVADANPRGSVVLLGKASTDLSVLEGAPNIHMLGRKAYAELPAYSKGWDVALMPFRMNELTLSSNPLKVREYLASGLPVVSTPVPEVEALGMCRIAGTPEAFVAQVEEAIQEGGLSAARSHAIASESWDARVDEIRGHLARLC
jgi:glycosyltransferase involved in cell wall biosynthesis